MAGLVPAMASGPDKDRNDKILDATYGVIDRYAGLGNEAWR